MPQRIRWKESWRLHLAPGSREHIKAQVAMPEVKPWSGGKKGELPVDLRLTGEAFCGIYLGHCPVLGCSKVMMGGHFWSSFLSVFPGGFCVWFLLCLPNNSDWSVRHFSHYLLPLLPTSWDVNSNLHSLFHSMPSSFLLLGNSHFSINTVLPIYCVWSNLYSFSKPDTQWKWIHILFKNAIIYSSLQHMFFESPTVDYFPQDPGNTQINKSGLS